MPTAGTPRMSAPARREQLLDAAKAVVAEHGFHGVSIEAVARGAGVTRPIVYRHFDDLAPLLAALVEPAALRAVLRPPPIAACRPGRARDATLAAPAAGRAPRGRRRPAGRVRGLPRGGAQR